MKKKILSLLRKDLLWDLIKKQGSQVTFQFSLSLRSSLVFFSPGLLPF